jgi:hypothetical protein
MWSRKRICKKRAYRYLQLSLQATAIQVFTLIRLSLYINRSQCFADNEYEEENDEEDDEEEEGEEDAEYDYTEYIPSREFSCATYYDNTWASVAGWGATYKAEKSCVLREAASRIYPNSAEICRAENLEAEAQTEDKICAYNPDWDTDTSCEEKRTVE